MVLAKNYETASTFVKVIQRKLLASYFPDTVYNVIVMMLIFYGAETAECTAKRGYSVLFSIYNCQSSQIINPAFTRETVIE